MESESDFQVLGYATVPLAVRWGHMAQAMKWAREVTVWADFIVWREVQEAIRFAIATLSLLGCKGSHSSLTQAVSMGNWGTLANDIPYDKKTLFTQPLAGSPP